jgi:hypothetical protein
MVGAAQCWPDLLDLRLGLGRRFAGQPRRFCAHRFIDDRHRAAQAWCAAVAGAYFSGIASATVHGWLWLVAAFVGSVLGTYLRPWFGLSVEGNLAGAQAGPTARD